MKPRPLMVMSVRDAEVASVLLNKQSLEAPLLLKHDLSPHNA